MRLGTLGCATAATITLAAMSSFAFAQVQPRPFQTVYALHARTANSAELILPAQLHPEVAVPRELAAQPTYPWLAPVRYGRATTVYVDPAARYPHLDENNSVVKAQRLYLDLHGVTTDDLAELRNASAATEPISSGGANTAQLLLPEPGAAPEPASPVEPRNIPATLPTPPRQPVPMPSVPRQLPPPGSQLAAAIY